MSGDLPRHSVSVALCTFNGQKHLQEQLDSIVCQTRLPEELIVCDDISTDETMTILRSFAEQAPFPVRIYQNSARMGSTLNFDRAMRLCQGDYIALCDQDDRWLPTKVATLAAVLDADPAIAMAFSDARLMDKDSKLTNKLLWHAFRIWPSVQEIFRRNPGYVLLQRPVVTGATMLVRRTLLEHYESIPASWVHDAWITWMSVLWSRLALVTEPLIDYRVHAAQQLGVGKTTFFARVQNVRIKQRKLYADLASAFCDLLAYVRTVPALEKEWGASLEEALIFYRDRAAAPVSLVSRIRFLSARRKIYRRTYGNTWKTFFRDALMR